MCCRCFCSSLTSARLEDDNELVFRYFAECRKKTFRISSNTFNIQKNRVGLGVRPEIGKIFFPRQIKGIAHRDHFVETNAKSTCTIDERDGYATALRND